MQEVTAQAEHLEVSRGPISPVQNGLSADDEGSDWRQVCVRPKLAPVKRKIVQSKPVRKNAIHDGPTLCRDRRR